MLARRQLSLAAVVAVGLALFPSQAAALEWKYRYFDLPKNDNQPITTQTDEAEAWLATLGPRPDGIRFVPSENGFHFWARHDGMQGQGWDFKHWGRNNWTNPMEIRNGLYDNTMIFGGFLRRKGKGPLLIQPYRDNQYAYVLTRTGPSLPPRTGWVYQHFGTAGSWQPKVEAFINGRHPGHASDIVGGLSRGKDFHLWVRKSTTTCEWELKHEVANVGLLNGRIRLGIAKGTIAPLGFNYQSPQHLWYAKLKSPESCLQP
ncbi:MAG: hypothetical protein KC731_07415 [Myxococcales bacterium]|nr:hypothetical protein [Myxococcales bacterium]